MRNSSNGIQRDIIVKGLKMGTSQVLGAVVSSHGDSLKV